MKKLFNHTKREYEADKNLEWDDLEYTEEFADEDFAENEDDELYYSDDEAYDGEAVEEEAYYAADDEAYDGEAVEEETYYTADDEAYDEEAAEEAYYATDDEAYDEEVVEEEAYYTADDEAYDEEAAGEEGYYAADDEAYDEEAAGEEGYYAADGEVYDEEAAGEEGYYAADDETYDRDDAEEEIYYEAEASAYDGEEAEEAYYEAEEAAYFEAESADAVYDEADAADIYDEAAGGASLYDEFYEAEEEEDEADEKEEMLPWSAMSDKNFFQKLWYSLVHMSTMDKVVTTTGILVLVLALATGAVYVSARAIDKEVASFDTVGSQLDNITVIGEHGLTAVADAELARISAANAIEEEEDNKDYEEGEYTKEVSVSLNMTSIEKDLKIKFVNSKTNRLVPNVPFSVTVTTPDGKTEIWSDDDMDGIIYKAGITPGNYSVSMNSLTDEKYADYKLPDTAQKVTVKKEIAYEKVEVVDEIKKESEIDVKKEDTKENETTVESVLQDTVGWVESTQTVVDSVYTAVPKSQVPDPLATAKSMLFMRTAEVGGTGNVSGGNGSTTDPVLPTEPPVDPTEPPGPVDPTTPPTEPPAAPAVTEVKLDSAALALKTGEKGTLTVTVEPADAENKKVSVKSSDEKVATAAADETGKITVTAVGAGTAIITVSSEADSTKTATCTVTVTAVQKPVITLNTASQTAVTALTLEKGKEEKLTAVVTGADADKQAVTFTSSDATVVSVDKDGKLKALKAGTATITVTLDADKEVKAECKVTVTEDTRTLTLSVATLNMAVGGAAQELKATIGNSVQGGVISGTVTAKSDNEAVAVVTVGKTENGAATITVTPKGAGTAKITVGILEADGKTQAAVTQVLTVTVGNGTITLNKTTLSVLAGSTAELTGTVNSTNTNAKITVTSSNDKVATATASGAVADGKTTIKVVVTGVGAGTATITVKHTDGGVATFTVTVGAKDGKLVSADKKQLFVLRDGKYVEATYTDYYNASITTFYIKSQDVVKYTGWQTINGKLYYYDASGKYVTGEQVIQGAKYTFASDGSLVVGNGAFGIDVSKWNGTIDWNAVKNSGVNYVIIRCGYRGSSSGALVVDPKFEANIKGATAAGIKVGVYFFSQAVNNSEAVEEASMVLELIKNYKISYPVFLDVEASGGRADGISVATRTDVIKTFCQTIQNSGYTAGVYANKNWLTTKIDTSKLNQYKIWLAQYASAPTYTGRYDMWQYKSTGKVTGISGDVDLNWSYLGY